MAYRALYLGALLVLALAPLLLQARQYLTGSLIWNNSTLVQLNTDGTLTGRYANFTTDRGWLDYQIWFVNSTFNSYLLCVIALNENKTVDEKIQVDARIIWTANRDNPVGENASFNFTSDGNLELKDERGQLVWSSNTYGSKVYYLYMSEFTGNVVLQTESGAKVWQSYDYPTDTLVLRRYLRPGMKLTSWASNRNSSVGDYSLVVEPGGLVMYAGSQPYWVLSSSGNQDLSTITKSTSQIFAVLCPDYTTNFEARMVYLELGTNLSSLDSSSDHVELGYDDCSEISARGPKLYLGINASLVTFLKLLPNGDFKVYTYKYDNSSFVLLYSQFGDDSCLLPKKCGEYRVCRNGTCGECFGGSSYIEVDKNQPQLGCEPVADRCSSELVELKGYDYFPIKYHTFWNATSKRECRDQCGMDCNCKAAFYNSSAASCFLVNNTVGTVQKVFDDNLIAFVKVLSKRKPIYWKFVAGGSAGAVVLIIFLLMCIMKRKKHMLASDSEEEAGILESSLKSMLPTRYSYQELEKLTNSFTQCIGAGGFGEVYRGKLQNGTEVAVKKLRGFDYDRKEFYTEIAVLGRSHHQNLVLLLGFCATASKSLLMYEYMKNGSLDRWVFGDKAPLNWKQRFEIILGTARGLAYLHEDCAEKIIHLDLKPQNILLDADLLPKIADFGISKLVDRKQSLVLTKMRGTPGYLAPEWVMEGAITEKADVYSYGVVVFEVVSGRKKNDLLREVCSNLHDISKEKSLIDEKVADNLDMDEADRVLRVASLCIIEDPSMRPSMSKVVHMLEGVVAIPDPPKLSPRIHNPLSMAFTRFMESESSTSDPSAPAHSSSLSSAT